ncbi:hemolysin family protein [Eubacteriales bacterium OttesenSCG-928-A19]|nr:hemolysin family protein [Eubacteriales bacterium OttesenSCG-928-A19]
MSADPGGSIGGSLLLQLVLILINAFFAATEIAVLSLNESILKRESGKGDAKTNYMLQMVQNPSQFLSTIQVGITLTGFLGSAFAASNLSGPLTEVLIRWGLTFIPRRTLDTISVVLITLILSYFTLVFGELVPKRIAMQNAYKVARFASGIIRVLSTVLRPVVWFLTKSTNAMLRLFRIDPNRSDDDVTEESIRMMVDIGEEKGAIEEGEAELIENIFEFNNSTAEELMVHRTDVSAVSITDTREEIVEMIEETGFSRFPVYDEDIDDVVGTLSTREYLLNLQAGEPRPLRDLVRPAHFVPETVRADILFREMQRKKNHMAVVVDEYGGTSGIVTMEDLIEEIFGDIYDEFDEQEEQEIVQLEPNLWRADGSVEIETLEEVLEIELPEMEFDTLGGLIYSCMTTIPEDGATPSVDAFGLHIQVEKIEDRRVESALVSKIIADVEDGGTGE